MRIILYSAYLITSFIYLIFSHKSIKLFIKSKFKSIPYLNFFILNFSFFFWTFCYLFIILTNDEKTFWFWINISKIVTIFYSFLIFNFFFSVKSINNQIKSTFLKGTIYNLFIIIPIILYICTFFKNSFYIGSHYSFLGFNTIYNQKSPIFLSYLIYTYTVLIFGITITIYWMIKTNFIKEKKQARVFIITVIISAILSTLTNVAFPLLKIYYFPKIIHINSLLIVFGIWYTFIKYNFLDYKPIILFENILDYLNNIVLFVNEKGIITKVNKKIEEILLYKKEEIINKKVYEIFNYEDLSLIFLNNNYNNLTPIINETYIINKEKNKIPVKIYIYPLIDEFSDFQEYLILIEDLSLIHKFKDEIYNSTLIQEKLKSYSKELEGYIENKTKELNNLNIKLSDELKQSKETNEQLLRSYSKLKTIFNIIPLPLIITDENGTIRDCNQKLLENFKFIVKNDIIGKNIDELFYSDNIKPIFEQIKEKNYKISAKINIKNNIKELSLSIEEITDYNNIIVGYLIIINLN